MLLGSSVIAYLGFYWNYIPQRGHTGQAYLQHHNPSKDNRHLDAPSIYPGPSAVVHFGKRGAYRQFLSSGQEYDISVKLEVPSSRRNVALGNFMVVVKLLDEKDNIVATANRPATLTYESTLLRVMRTIWRTIPLVLRWSREAEVLQMSMIENFVQKSSHPVVKAYLEISSPDLQIYKSSVHIDAHFHGLRQHRYFMYHHYAVAALIFNAIFIFWEIVFSLLTWQVLTTWFGTNPGARRCEDQQQLRQQQQQQQNQQLHSQLRAPTSYLAVSTETASRAHQLQAPTATPREPQLQEDQMLLGFEDAESEVDHDLLDGRGDSVGSRSNAGDGDSQQLMFDHDEMDDELDLEHLDGSFIDEGIVPEHPAALNPTWTSASCSAPHLAPLPDCESENESENAAPVSSLPSQGREDNKGSDRAPAMDDTADTDDGAGVRFGASTLFERRSIDTTEMRLEKSSPFSGVGEDISPLEPAAHSL
ncbi:hypothetical protein BGZ67_000889 [Mortierella alpina]|nr:hypothetical protein BGZ67_000889 [Mortierella alpina]